MLKIGDKEYRNLEEQVLKNKSDIESIVNEQGTLNQFGIKVVDVVADVLELPESADEYGDAYAVGTDTPYKLYVWTRANTTHPNDYWFNIGEFPLPGPQGPVGPRGPQGEKGERGIQGPQGVQGIQGIAGPQGDTGPQGPQGVQGPKGEKGDPGEGFRVVGVLSNVNQLPTPSVEIQNEAYLVTIDGAYHLYLITGESPNLLWTDCGRIEGVQGPQGPQGIQGPQGPKGDTGNTGAKGDQGIQGIQGPQGNTGATGNGISSITIDSGTAVTGGTQYVMTITYTNGNTDTQTFVAKSAGFGTPTASATTVTGNPTASVTASGPDTAKIFNFTFGIPQSTKLTLLGSATIASSEIKSGSSVTLNNGYNQSQIDITLSSAISINSNKVNKPVIFVITNNNTSFISGGPFNIFTGYGGCTRFSTGFNTYTVGVFGSGVFAQNGLLNTYPCSCIYRTGETKFIIASPVADVTFSYNTTSSNEKTLYIYVLE